MLTDQQLIERAERAGWKWIENDAKYPGSEKHPFSGWSMNPDGTSHIYFNSLEKGIDTLRGNAAGKKSLGFDHDIDCHECGQPVWLNWKNDDELIADRLCIHCIFWVKIIREIVESIANRLTGQKSDSAKPSSYVNNVWNGPSSLLVIEEGEKRTLYNIGKGTEKDKFRGFGGSWWTVNYLDGRQRETCDLWHRGTIPPHFWDRFPVNAILTSGRIEQQEKQLAGRA